MEGFEEQQKDYEEFTYKLEKLEKAYNQLLIETEKYNGKFVKLSSELRPSINNVDRKSFSTVLVTGSNSWKNDNSFRLEVFYRELEAWKDFGTMTLDRDEMIRVEETFYIYI